MADEINTPQDGDETELSAKPQPDLFPEGKAAAGADIAQQLVALAPDELAAMAAALEPDVKTNLVQAVFSTMTPEEKAQVDTVPSQDVSQNMDNATAERPEQQYQMSVATAQKRLETTPGMSALAEDRAASWSQRADSLHEDGWLSKEKHEDFKAKFSKKGENRFSVILDGNGLLHDECLTIEVLEEARASSASLSKSVLSNGGRFSASRPAQKPAEDDGFDMEAAKAAGKRLAAYN